MKHFYLNLKLILLMLITALPISAYDFEVVNSDGVSIAYTITSTNTVDVAKNGEDFNGSPISNYSGIINIPSFVKYSGITYSVTGIEESAFECCEITSVQFLIVLKQLVLKPLKNVD